MPEKVVNNSYALKTMMILIAGLLILLF
jgi:hypothetical protein